MDSFPPDPAPASQDCHVVELRQYTLKAGRRDTLVELFDREFIEPQEAVGMRVMGQFRDLDDPDRFVWLRGFAGMDTRARGLEAFYGGPVWAAHRAVANSTMVDSDDVLLLRPAWPGSGVQSSPGDRAAPGSTRPPPGAVHAAIVHLAQPADEGFIESCRALVAGVVGDAGARFLGCYVTESAPNNFPRLPVREGANVMVVLARTQAIGRRLEFELPAGAQSQPPRHLRLAPTARSAIHA